MASRGLVAIVLFLSLFLFPARAEAYVDPGTGSYVLQLLIAAKAPLDAQNRDGATALMLAAGAGQREAVRLLLLAHADARVQDYSGHDALSYAEDNRHPPCVQLLRAASTR